MNKWEFKPLRELLQRKGYIRGPFGSALIRSEMKQEGNPVYEQKNAIYNSREFRFFIDEEKFDELSRFQVRTNDLIISCSGTVGKISIISEDDPKGIISQALLILRPDIEKITLKFLYYFLSSDIGFRLITQVSHGSVQVNIAKREVVETIPIPVPPIDEQKAIAGVLSSLDDKIDLLRRQNETLEALAQTLFRQWFVEQAQDDWEDGVINDIIELQPGFGFKSKSFIEAGKYRVITIKNVQDGLLDLSKTSFLDEIPKRMPNYCQLKYKDILLSLTGNVGRCCLVSDENLLLNQRIAKLRPRNLRDWAFTYFYFRQPQTKNLLIALARGTAQKNLSIQETINLDLKIPFANILRKFSEIASPLLEKIMANKKQISTLEDIRETLLPKLMSGKVRVNYAAHD
jgi:type I restriction enzyme, S subunit